MSARRPSAGGRPARAVRACPDPAAPRRSSAGLSAACRAGSSRLAPRAAGQARRAPADPAVRQRLRADHEQRGQSGLGIVYWTLAARLYDPPSRLGVNAAAISAMTFISYLAQLNMAGVLSRFIPTAGLVDPPADRAGLPGRRAVSRPSGALVFVVWFAGLVGRPGQMLAVDPLRRRLVRRRDRGVEPVRAPGRRADRVCVGRSGSRSRTRSSGWPRSSCWSSSWRALAGSGIFASWTIPAAFLVLPVNWLIFRRFVPATSPPTGRTHRRSAAAGAHAVPVRRLRRAPCSTRPRRACCRWS